jgi:hypothetical protein
MKHLVELVLVSSTSTGNEILFILETQMFLDKKNLILNSILRNAAVIAEIHYLIFKSYFRRRISPHIKYYKSDPLKRLSS